MGTFEIFRNKITENINKLQSYANLFVVEIDKDLLWETYLNSFPEGTNLIFRKRREYDCSACRHFIKQYGTLMAINPNTLNLETIWDDVSGFDYFDIVAKKVNDFIKNYIDVRTIIPFFSKFKKLGVHHNIADIEGQIFTFNHFYCELKDNYITDNPNTLRSNIQSKYKTLNASIEQINNKAIETVIDLINDENLYRGEQYKFQIDTFKNIKEKFEYINDPIKQQLYLWLEAYKKPESVTNIKNTSIGQLLVNISNNISVEEAVKKYEDMVAPANYQRPKPIVTTRMIEDAKKKIAELGLDKVLNRRIATVNDLNINNSLYVNRNVKSILTGNNILDILDEVKKEIPKRLPSKTIENIPEIKIDEFIEKILPNSNDIKVYINEQVLNNLMALTTSNEEEPKLFKWNNQFAWVYAGGYADAIKEKVKSAGGNVDGEFRISLHWFNLDDLDLHLEEYGGNHVFYANVQGKYMRLDVDMNVTDPIRGAVENIYCDKAPKNLNGKVWVNNYQKREQEGKGFIVQVEFKGEIWEFIYNENVRHKENVPVFSFEIKDGKFRFTEKYLNDSESTIVKWGLKTPTFVEVKAITLSPNYWHNNIGQKHYFFFLEGVKPQEPLNGFILEFLREDLKQYRRLFELLSNKLKVNPIPEGLYGIGFTKGRNQKLIVSANNRLYKITF